MGKGHKTRISAIVDKIVDGNIEFNKKSMQKQDLDKVNMIDEIAKSLTTLNEMGQKLVLDELDARANSNSLEFLDNNGNLSISELTKLTSTIVVSTVENAKRDGIDLTRDGGNLENSNETTKTILTSSEMDKKIENFGQLSHEERKQVFDNWDALSTAQKSSVRKEVSKKLKQCIETEQNEERKEIMTDFVEVLERAEEETERISTLDENEASEEIEDYIAVASTEEIARERQNLVNLGREQGKSEEEILMQLHENIHKKQLTMASHVCFDEVKLETTYKVIKEDIYKYQEESFKLSLLRDEEFLRKCGLTRKEAREIIPERMQILVDKYNQKHADRTYYNNREIIT
ncbi:MAG: hypothetical protein IKL55_04105 [Clostridia bacterium]|nr:hypothetical protein [Clostridia bacterium]